MGAAQWGCTPGYKPLPQHPQYLGSNDSSTLVLDFQGGDVRCTLNGYMPSQKWPAKRGEQEFTLPAGSHHLKFFFFIKVEESLNDSRNTRGERVWTNSRKSLAEVDFFFDTAPGQSYRIIFADSGKHTEFGRGIAMQYEGWPPEMENQFPRLLKVGEL